MHSESSRAPPSIRNSFNPSNSLEAPNGPNTASMPIRDTREASVARVALDAAMEAPTVPLAARTPENPAIYLDQETTQASPTLSASRADRHRLRSGQDYSRDFDTRSNNVDAHNPNGPLKKRVKYTPQDPLTVKISSYKPWIEGAPLTESPTSYYYKDSTPSPGSSQHLPSSGDTWGSYGSTSGSKASLDSTATEASGNKRPLGKSTSSTRASFSPIMLRPAKQVKRT